MNKTQTRPGDEAYALIEATTGLFHSVSDTFLKNAKEGCIEISEESTRFTVSMKLERKKEAKSGK